MLLRCHRSLRCRYPLRATIRRLRDDGDNESRMRVLERLNSNFLNLQIREYCLLFKLNARFLAGQAGSGIVVSVLHLAFLAISCFDKGEVCVFLGFGSTMNPLLMFASPTLLASEMTKCVCVSIWNHYAVDVVLWKELALKCVSYVVFYFRRMMTSTTITHCPTDADCSLDSHVLAVSGLKLRVVTMLMYSRVEIIPNEHDYKRITRSCVFCWSDH
ncbi:hypothetical protein Tco_0261167 [Tanacetum coccineum]